MQTPGSDKLRELFADLAQGAELDHMLARIADHAAAELGVPCVKIWAVKRGDLCERCELAAVCANRQMCMHLMAAHGADIKQEHPRIPLSVFNATLISRGGVAGFQDPAGTGEKLFGRQRTAGNQRDAYAVYPLRSQDGTVGLIGIYHNQPIDKPTMKKLVALAPVAVAAIRFAELQARAEALQIRLQKESAAAAQAERAAARRESELEDAVADLTHQVAKLQAERDPLARGLNDATARAEHLEAENRTLRAQIEQARTAQQDASRAFSETVAKWEGERRQLEEENAWLKGRIAHLEQNWSELSLMHEARLAEALERSREAEHLRGELEARDADLETARRQLEQARHEVEQARLSAEDAQRTADEKLAGLESLSRQAAEARQENQQLLGEIDRLRHEIDRLGLHAAELESENGRLAALAAEASASGARLAELEAENAALVEANRQLAAAASEHEARAGELEAQLAPLRDRLEAGERARAELEQRQRALAEQNRRLAQDGQDRARFLASMSHELRTPMNAIIGFTALLLDDPALALSERHRRSLERVSRNARDLLELINNVLDLSKIDAGRMDVYAEAVDPRDLVERAMAVVEPLREGRDIELVADVEADLPVLRTDRTKVQQILINLLSNAVKFTAEGRVHISAARAGDDRIQLTVSDTGVGISAEDLPRIFDEFRQVGDAARGSRGTGLGLAITKRLVELLGGEIDVHSRLGEGTTFTVKLPAVIQGRVAAEYDSLPADPERAALVIDADPGSLYLMKKYLGEAGYAVTATDDLLKGLSIARMARPALVMVDLDSLEEGAHALESLRAEVEGGAMLALSADPANEEAAREAGAMAFLRKPVEREELAQVLDRVRQTVRPQVLIVDDDDDARELVLEMLDSSGYDLRAAVDGRQAMQEIARLRPDALILDLMLPEMDGFEVVHRLRLNAEWRSIPVLLLTARDLSHEERRALDGRNIRLIQKGSFSRDELLAEVRAMIGESARHAPVEEVLAAPAGE